MRCCPYIKTDDRPTRDGLSASEWYRGRAVMTSSKLDVKRCRVYSKHTLLKPSDLESLLCPFCGGLLRDPVQVIACGDRFCRCCMDKLMSHSDGPYICPVDNDMFVRSEVRTDKGCLKELQRLEIECTTQPTPCTWRGPLTKLEDHLVECPNVEVDCRLGCGRRILKSQLSSHMSSLCPNRLAECQYCHTSVPLHHLDIHFQSCEYAPILCDYCEQHLTSRKQLKEHLECCVEYSSHTLPINRPQDCGQMHNGVELVVGAVDKVGTQKANKTLLPEFHPSSEVLYKKLEDIEASISRNTKQLDRQQKQIFKLSDNVEKLVNFWGTISTLQGGEEASQSRREHVVSNIEAMYTVTSFQSLDGALSQSSSTEGVVRQMKLIVDSQWVRLLRMSQNLQAVERRVTQQPVVLPLRQDVLDVKNTNGILVWKIPAICRYFRDAVDQRIISLYSPPFYTSSHGYRMCIRTYLNGDGIGKGTHISLFFVVMRSEQDYLLPWPFKQIVRFTLINQKNPAASITAAFMPDPRSPSFQRPNKEMNVASGFPQFARQSVLRDDNFTQGNIVYIKCQVDLTGLTEMM